jgi:hypothetical protein
MQPSDELGLGYCHESSVADQTDKGQPVLLTTPGACNRARSALGKQVCFEMLI